MITLTKEKSEKIDQFLEKLIEEETMECGFVYDFFNDKDESIVICEFLKSKGLVSLSNGTYIEPFIFVTAEHGLSTFLKNGGIKKTYLDLNSKREKEEIESKKSKVDLELAEKMLKEFPKTKWFARIGAFIGIVLMLKELYILIWK